MSNLSRLFLCLISPFVLHAQTGSFPYVFKTIAGAFPLGDKGLATAALLDYPNAVALDSAGNIYVNDSYDYLIRKVSANGTINTLQTTPVFVNDMKLGSDGNFYLAAYARVYKMTPDGVSSVIAGTGVLGSSGDGGPATSAQIGDVQALCFDSTGNIYFTEGNKVREVTLVDGKIKTIAGTGTAGYNGDNILATSARLNQPLGITFDNSGNLLIADQYNLRVRKVNPQGYITTILGTGFFDYPTRTAASSAIGMPGSVAVDSNGYVNVTDSFWNVVFRITPQGILSILAGDGSLHDAPSDGLAAATSLDNPYGLTIDSQGSIYVADSSHRVRKITPSDGLIRTVVGRIHYGGDNGPAMSAVLNEPAGITLDSKGDIFFADGYNYRLRKITPDGTITALIGTGFPGYPTEGAGATNSPVYYVDAVASDAAGNLYLGTASKILKISSAGICTTFAGNGAYADSGDNGPATKASLQTPGALAVDALGNVYVADTDSNRIRKISTDGTIAAFAGTGTKGRIGDGGLASGAQFDFTLGSALAFDLSGNLYIADTGNSVVRVIAPGGIVTTFAGNGKKAAAFSDGQAAKSVALSPVSSIAADANGNIFLSSLTLPQIYEVTGGNIRTISGVSSGTFTDGVAATTVGFIAWGIAVDSNSDLYATDATWGNIRKLIYNSPTAFTISDGNNQSATVGQSPTKTLKVLVTGRTGPVPGASVNFSVASGSATLSASSTQTDLTGVAGVVVTMGSTAGPVVVTASTVGTGLSPVKFTLTANAALPAGCPGFATITSVKSAADFGGSATFASGSWMEIKGTNLSATTRLWQGSDFTGSSAPTSLDGNSVAIDGINGYPMYISPTQINVQAPADTAVGPISVTVTTCAGPSLPFAAQKAVNAPGLLAPSAFNVGGKQYLVALFSDGATYVGAPNLIPGVAFRPAAPGDSLTAYGIGFGEVTPAVSPGTVTPQSNSLLATFTLAFGTTPATVGYNGLAPAAIGLYQFNFTVPNVPDGDYLLDIRLGGQKLPGSLFLTVQAAK